MDTVLLTGASGFVGINLCRVLHAKGIKTYAVFRREGSYNDELRTMNNVIPVFCDLNKITELSERIHCNSIDTVFHLAWAGVSGNTRGDYERQLSNIDYTLRLLSVIKELGCKRFVGVGSTAEIDAYNAAVTDGVCPNLVSMYGISKMATHFMTKVICNELGMEHIWGIIGNVYGVGDKSNNFINFATKLIMSEDEAKFTLGEQNYDFVYITDVAQALFYLGENGYDKCSYYIGSGQPRKLKDYIVSIRDYVNPRKKLELGAIPFNGVSADIKSFSIDKLMVDTGFTPEVPFESGIKKTVNWLRGIHNANI